MFVLFDIIAPCAMVRCETAAHLAELTATLMECGIEVGYHYDTRFVPHHPQRLGDARKADVVYAIHWNVFAPLRGNPIHAAVWRLVIAGAKEPEIAAIIGDEERAAMRAMVPDDWSTMRLPSPLEHGPFGAAHTIGEVLGDRPEHWDRTIVPDTWHGPAGMRIHRLAYRTMKAYRAAAPVLMFDPETSETTTIQLETE